MDDTNISSSSDEQTLNKLFETGFELYNDINNTQEPTNSENVQLKIKNAIEIFEKATRLVSLADIFSRNESLEELSNDDIKFMLLPVLLGMLALKICHRDRKEIIDASEIYFNDFLTRCYDYGITETNLMPNKNNQDQNKIEDNLSDVEKIRRMINTRQNKIERYKEQKALEAKLNDLKKCFDEDIKREFYITLIKSFIYQAVDELKSLEMEKPMIEMFKARNEKSNNAHSHKKSPTKLQPHQPLRPVIITKDAVQKAVFGAGYPSLPVMTVDEFYDKRVKDGIFPSAEKMREINQKTLQGRALAGEDLNDHNEEEAEEDEKEDKDDEEYLARLRQRDEMKDEFRRGFGNRMNRS